jgi:hypothetical protein
VSAEEFDETTDPDARLEALFDSIRTLQEKCLIATALRTTLEARRLAKAERSLVPYLTANFYVMNLAQDLFDPDAGREAAIENIALLESAERARAFQPDYDEAEYEGTVQWMSACSYDNLATATGMLQGYNSPGMQACIADGIAVCRRTGKLRCSRVFPRVRDERAPGRRRPGDGACTTRERTLNVTPGGERGDDRRFIGGHDLAQLLTIAGQFEPAYAAATQALALAGDVPQPAQRPPDGAGRHAPARPLANRPEWVAAGADPQAELTPRGEDRPTTSAATSPTRWPTPAGATTRRRSNASPRGTASCEPQVPPRVVRGAAPPRHAPPAGRAGRPGGRLARPLEKAPARPTTS